MLFLVFDLEIGSGAISMASSNSDNSSKNTNNLANTP